jgi:hypothetical protein
VEGFAVPAGAVAAKKPGRRKAAATA